MSHDGKPTVERNTRADKYGSSALLPLGIVFLIVAVAMAIIVNPAWIAFLGMGITFLILGIQNRRKNKSDTPAP
ncbi:hypothetical protein StoSoilA2_43710 [Arthrobacter sp. StoSoilA2]|uniref:hypothetical protein n=1 Tax=unclassified Arthrobacter TaxID=235627 RepID=UPI001CC3CFFF|nr:MULTISPECIES: hypothetical protein [unclassified Arthrobacter]MDR6686525.1 hypothetical protein [Arthrobacter sp. 1088]BCW38315.1 hypothetical protein StoSoilA2_43710 [Arthrobacter sp. StoSoilA2]